MQIGEKAAWQSGLIQLSSCEGIVCVCGIGAAASGRLSARQARDHLIERKHTRAVWLAGWHIYRCTNFVICLVCAAAGWPSTRRSTPRLARRPVERLLFCKLRACCCCCCSILGMGSLRMVAASPSELSLAATNTSGRLKVARKNSLLSSPPAGRVISTNRSQ